MKGLCKNIEKKLEIEKEDVQNDPDPTNQIAYNMNFKKSQNLNNEGLYDHLRAM